MGPPVSNLLLARRGVHELARRGALRGRLQRVTFDVAVRTETSKGGTHVLRSLVREEVGQRGFVRGFFPPRPRENLDLRSGEGPVGVAGHPAQQARNAAMELDDGGP